MRILLVRTSALGDVVHALPVLTALRRDFPNAQLAWVVEEAFAPLLVGHPALDRVIPVRTRAWRKKPLSFRTVHEVRRLVGALRSFRPDVAIDLMGNHKAGVLARLSGAPHRVGFAAKDRRERSSRVWINEPVSVGGHAVSRGLALAGHVGASIDRVDFGGDVLPSGPLHCPESDRSPFAVIVPGAGWENKRYPTEKWARVGDQLRERLDLSILVVTGPGEERLGEQIVANATGSCHHVHVPALPPLVTLLRQAALVLGGDTGPIHLAQALGRPTLAVMGPTDPQRHGLYGAVDRCVYERLPCSFCHRRYEAPQACLLGLDPAKVASRAIRLFETVGAHTEAPREHASPID